jgi:hypothetical protein
MQKKGETAFDLSSIPDIDTAACSLDSIVDFLNLQCSDLDETTSALQATLYRSLRGILLKLGL